MIHTYRDPSVDGAPSRGRALAEAGAFVLLVGLLLLGLARTEFTSSERAQLLFLVALTAGIAAVLSWRYRQRVCREIRLDDDAETCDFETMRGMIALHVQQITAVQYDDDGDSRCEYCICYEGGSIPVERGMAAFDDFLTRLTALNSSVDLSSLPGKVWHGEETTQARGSPTPARILFPFGVIVVLAWLAFESFTPR